MAKEEKIKISAKAEEFINKIDFKFLKAAFNLDKDTLLKKLGEDGIKNLCEKQNPVVIRGIRVNTAADGASMYIDSLRLTPGANGYLKPEPVLASRLNTSTINFYGHIEDATKYVIQNQNSPYYNWKLEDVLKEQLKTVKTSVVSKSGEEVSINKPLVVSTPAITLRVYDKEENKFVNKKVLCSVDTFQNNIDVVEAELMILDQFYKHNPDGTLMRNDEGELVRNAKGCFGHELSQEDLNDIMDGKPIEKEGARYQFSVSRMDFVSLGQTKEMSEAQAEKRNERHQNRLNAAADRYQARRVSPEEKPKAKKGAKKSI